MAPIPPWAPRGPHCRLQVWDYEYKCYVPVNSNCGLPPTVSFTATLTFSRIRVISARLMHHPTCKRRGLGSTGQQFVHVRVWQIPGRQSRNLGSFKATTVGNPPPPPPPFDNVSFETRKKEILQTLTIYIVLHHLIITSSVLRRGRTATNTFAEHDWVWFKGSRSEDRDLERIPHGKIRGRLICRDGLAEVRGLLKLGEPWERSVRNAIMVQTG